MNENTPQAAQDATRSPLLDKANKLAFEAYQLGMLHAAYLLRAEGMREVSAEATDRCAAFIEYEARNCHAIRPWPVEQTQEG